METKKTTQRARRNWMENRFVLVGLYVMGAAIMALQLRSIL